jgi:hypothetical protein
MLYGEPSGSMPWSRLQPMTPYRNVYCTNKRCSHRLEILRAKASARLHHRVQKLGGLPVSRDTLQEKRLSYEAR